MGVADKAKHRPLNPDFVVIAAIAATSYLTMSIKPLLADGDTGWHVAAGGWIIEHGAVPTTDPFSFTFGGRKWIPHEWLSEVLMALSYNAAGWGGVTLLFAGAGAALIVILGFYLRRWLPAPATLVVLASVLALLQPFMLARPHFLALPILATWTIILLLAREDDRAPPILAAGLMLLWANMHGSFVFGLALIAPFAIEALVSAPDRRLRTALLWGRFGILAGAAALVTPHGVDGLLFPFEVSAMKSLPLIIEWQSAQFDRIGGFELILIAFLLFALTRGLRVPAIRLAILVGLLHLGLHHIRHQMILGVVGALILAEPMGRLLIASAALPKPTLRDLPAGPVQSWRKAVIGMLIVVGATTVIRLALPMERPDYENVPMTALAHVPAELRTAPVFNNYSFGGSLIFAGIRPFIDGRADLYGDAFILQFVRIRNGNVRAWREAERRWGIRWTILSPSERLTKVLDREPGWRRIYSDKYAVIHVRR